MKSPYKYFILTAVLVIIDQVIKMWMHYDVLPNHYGNLPVIPDVFDFHYVLNPGMAFGMEIGGDYGKLFLSIFRLFATGAIAWYILHLSRNESHSGLIWSVAAILGGALGNVIDSTFYGVFIENNVIPNSSTPWFHGQVIDMFYFEVFDGFWPEWVPFWGGSYNSTPIFNFADASIFCGVASIIIFQQSFLEPATGEATEYLTDSPIDHLPIDSTEHPASEIPETTHELPNGDSAETSDDNSGLPDLHQGQKPTSDN